MQGEKPKFNIFSYKIRSFNANHKTLFCLFDNPSNYSKILVISETWFNVDNVHETQNYNSYHIMRTSGRSSEMSVFVKSFITSTRISELSIVDDLIEITAVDIKLNDFSAIILFSIYRPHSRTIENFVVVTREILEHRVCAIETSL